MVKTPVGELAPDNVAQPVAVVQKPLLEDLFVKPGAVKAHGKGTLNIGDQRFVGGGSVHPIGIEALVQHKPLEHRFAVDIELVAVNAHAAQAKVAVHRIVAVGKLQIVQSALANLPQMGFGKLQAQHRLTPGADRRRLPYRTALVACPGSQHTAALHRGVNGKDTVVDIGMVFCLYDMGLGQKFQPHRLPNSRSPGIEAAVGCVPVALLAGRDHRICRIVRGVDGEGVDALFDIVCNVKAEGNVSAFVLTAKYAVDINRGFVVHTAVDMIIDGKRFATLPHAVILYAPGVPQYFTNREGFVHDWFHFSGDFSGLVLENFKPNTLFYPKSFDYITKITSDMENEYFSSRPNRAEMLTLLTKELFIKLDRSLDETEKDRDNISADLEARFRAFRCELFSSLDARWTVGDMASRLGFSPSRFAVLYKSIFGISPTQDLINARINAAKNMLFFRDQKVEDIAALLGYQNVTHFIRQFKAVTGMTPSRYRKSTKQS